MDPFAMTLERRLEVPPSGADAPEEDHGLNYWFWCHPCDTFHFFRVRAAKGRVQQPLWMFNGNMDKPTFQPSLRYASIGCHLTLTDGVITYHDDSKHPWAGKKALLGASSHL